MKSVNEIKEIIMEYKRELEEKFKVKNIAIFGSYARNEQRKTSDVDILVEFSEPVRLLFFHLADYLEKILGVKVDLLTVDGIKPNRRKYVMENIIYV